MRAPASAVILAGGASRRMGHDKALLRLPDRRTCLEAVLQAAGAVATEIILAVDTQEHAARLLGDYQGLLPALLFDAEPGQGPLAVLAHALAVARHPVLLVLAADMPLVAPAVLSALVQAITGLDSADIDAAVPMIEGFAQPLCACYASRLGPIATALVRSGRRDVRALLARPDVRIRWLAEADLRPLDPSLQSFLSANTPEEWERLHHTLT